MKKPLRTIGLNNANGVSEIVEYNWPESTLPVKQANVELLIYELDPGLRDEFLAEFYPKVIIPWLKKYSVTQSDVWTVERDSGLQLIVVSSPDPPPWEDIEGLRYFLNGSHPLRIKSHPYLNITVEPSPN